MEEEMLRRTQLLWTFSWSLIWWSTLANKIRVRLIGSLLGQIIFLCTFLPNNFLLDSVALSGLLLKDFPSPPVLRRRCQQELLNWNEEKERGSGRFTRGNYQFILIYKNTYWLILLNLIKLLEQKGSGRFTRENNQFISIKLLEQKGRVHFTRTLIDWFWLNLIKLFEQNGGLWALNKRIQKNLVFLQSSVHLNHGRQCRTGTLNQIQLNY